MRDLIIKISGLFICLLLITNSYADIPNSNPNKAFRSAPQPEHPFPDRTTLKTPDEAWGDVKKPYPSAAWFGNFALRGGSPEYPDKESGMQPMFPTPYTIKNMGNGLAFSITSPTFAKDDKGKVFAQIYPFDPQMQLGAYENGDFKRSITEVNDLSATLQYSLNGKQAMSFPIVRGAPYITVMYDHLTPVIMPKAGPASINGHPPGTTIPANTRFELVLNLPDNNTQTWLIYSESPITLAWQNSAGIWQLVAHAPYDGWLRMALLQDTKMGINNDATLFDKYARTIPTAGDMKIVDQDTITFSWKTNNGLSPLMMSLPHQRKLFGANMPVTNKISYRVTQGEMQAVVGMSTWKMDLTIPKVSFLELSNHEVSKIPAERRQAIITAIKEESQSVINTANPDGPYGAGKHFARAARLALLANQFSQFDKELVDIRKNITNEISKNLTAWIKGENKFILKINGKDATINNTLIYDTTWGGIIPTVDDFGSQIYNDHHFHYGYFVYTYAVLTELAKADSSIAMWLKTPVHSSAGGSVTPSEWIKTLIRDYANPNAKDDYFPYARYVDFFNGHSYASGFIAAADGRNQESVSEAVNAYYAIALLADAEGDKELAQWGKLLMTQELNAAHTYWQIGKNNDIYAPEFANANQLATIIFDGKVDNHTWFGNNKEYIYGIQMMPFNGFTNSLLQKSWIKEAYPVITGITLPNDNAWKWILIKGRVLGAPSDEVNNIWNSALESPAAYYDGGDSKANTLYFIAMQGVR